MTKNLNSLAIAASLALSLVFLHALAAPPIPPKATNQLKPNDTGSVPTTTSRANVTETSASTTENGSNGSTTATGDDPLISGDTIEFTSSQNTSTFTCNGKVTGYYADVKLHCRVYHFCTQMDRIDGPTYQRMSYLCLENSYFDQRDLNCVKESDMKVPCSKAEAEYEKSNKQFDPKEDSQPSMSDNLAANLMMNPLARFIAGR